MFFLLIVSYPSKTPQLLAFASPGKALIHDHHVNHQHHSLHEINHQPCATIDTTDTSGDYHLATTDTSDTMDNYHRATTDTFNTTDHHSLQIPESWRRLRLQS